jgi:hypothetical protein
MKKSNENRYPLSGHITFFLEKKVLSLLEIMGNLLR